jgi:signal recognition particle subunit SRP14
MAQADGAEDTREYPCLIRVTDGGSAKFSTRVRAIHRFTLNSRLTFPSCTQVSSGELEKFHHAYGTLLKASMSTLRKRDKKREKLRVEQAARRKKKMTEPIVVDGPKRGNGRRKRQRLFKALAKQEVSQQKAKEREEASAKSSGPS